VRILFYLILASQLLLSEVYYSKVQPYKFKKITSNVIGEVTFIDEDMLGKKLSKKPFLLIDAEIDLAELTDVREKLVSLKDTLKLNQNVLHNLKEVLKRKRVNFKKTEALKIKSRIDKDREFYDLVASENSFIATQKEVNSLKNSVADLELREIQLKKSIRDKKGIQEGYMLYSLDVEEGQVVTVGTPLARVADISKALLILYIDAEELQDIEKKSIYIDGKKTDYKILRLLRIADGINISKYKVQIAIKAPKVFSQLVKVEFKGHNDEK